MEKAFEKLKKFVLQTNVFHMDKSYKELTFSEFEEKYMELKRLFFPISNVVVEKSLNENDSCGGMELHASPIMNNHCKDEKVFAYYEDLVSYKVLYIYIYIYTNVQIHDRLMLMFHMLKNKKNK